MKLFLFPTIFIVVFFSYFVSYGQQREVLKLKKYKVALLSDTIDETSGLDFFKGKLYTFNDSGNSPRLYEIAKENGAILKTYTMDFPNVDWESLSHDENSLYIGDFGNNLGTRKDLSVYKVQLTNDSTKIQAQQKINFYYPEQKDFSPKNINNDFDGEAMLYKDGKIHVFTKEWASKKVSHYALDPALDSKESQPARLVESYPTGFVVTDAAYYNGWLYLVGYTKKLKVYLQVFEETEPGIFFKGKSIQYYLGSALKIGQLEGITVDKDGVYFSSEAFHHPLGKVKQRYFFVPKSKFNFTH